MDYKYGLYSEVPASEQSRYMCTYLSVGKVNEGERGYVRYTVGYVTRRISVGDDTGTFGKSISKAWKTRGREDSDSLRLPQMQQFPPPMILPAQAARSDCVQTLGTSMGTG